MPSPEEVSAWSLDEIQAEIRVLAPASKLHVAFDSAGFWTVEVSGDAGVEAEAFHTDKRIALLNVFGELWTRSLPGPSESSPWVRRREIPLPVPQSTGDEKDPEDLDPVDVEMVYRPKS